MANLLEKSRTLVLLPPPPRLQIVITIQVRVRAVWMRDLSHALSLRFCWRRAGWASLLNRLLLCPLLLCIVHGMARLKIGDHGSPLGKVLTVPCQPQLDHCVLGLPRRIWVLSHWPDHCCGHCRRRRSWLRRRRCWRRRRRWRRDRRWLCLPLALPPAFACAVGSRQPIVA